MIRRTLVLGLFLSLAVTAFGQPTSTGGIGFRDWIRGGSTASLGLINPSKLTVNHTASFGFASGGGQSVMQSLYATRFGYQLSNPVTLTFMLGVQNSRYSGYNYLPGNVNSFFGGVALDYTPTDNMWFHLELQHNPFSTLRAYESSLPVTKPK